MVVTCSAKTDSDSLKRTAEQVRSGAGKSHRLAKRKFEPVNGNANREKENSLGILDHHE